MPTTLNSKYFFLLLLFTSLSCTTVNQESQYQEELERYVNVRFTFSVLVPKKFHRTFSTNGDGIILTSAENKNIEIRAWGNHNALFHTFEEEVKYINEGQKVLFLKDISSKLIKGKKIITEEDDLRSIRILLYRDDIFYSVLCQAPKNDFNKYEKLFEKITQSIRLDPPPN